MKNSKRNLKKETPLASRKRERGEVYYSQQKLTGKTPEQQRYINSLYEFNFVVAEGDAGTGKTFPPSVIALDMLLNPKYPVEKIVLVRPNVELGDPIGFLKGDLYEKMKPWMVPFMDGFEYRLDNNAIRNLVNSERIEFVPPAYLRGRTWNNCFVIVDEAQNLKYDAMKCLLRRIGQDCKIAVCADLDQCDLKNPNSSALHLLYSIDNLARDTDILTPYSWHVLEGSVWSETCEWFGTMIKEVEKNNASS